MGYNHIWYRIGVFTFKLERSQNPCGGRIIFSLSELSRKKIEKKTKKKLKNFKEKKGKKMEIERSQNLCGRVNSSLSEL